MANRISSINLKVAQITDLTQPLSLAQGGVGATTPEGGRKTLGFEDLGIGVLNQTALTSLDWQQYDFTNGTYFLINSSNWTNPPSGFPTVASGEIWHVEVVGIAGTVIQLQVVTNTVTDSSFKAYSIRITGNKASRTAKTRKFLVDTDAVPITSGGTGATTLAGAQAALGINTSVASLNFLELTAYTNAATTGTWTPPGNRNMHVLTLTGATTIAAWPGVTGTTKPKAFSAMIYLIQDATGGRTVTLDGSYKLLNTTSILTTANSVTILQLTYCGVGNVVDVIVANRT